MATVIRNVADINPNDREVLEHVLGQSLCDNQQLAIRITTLQMKPTAATLPSKENATLPDWCNVYAGLSDEEIADLEKVILTRADLSRPSE